MKRCIQYLSWFFVWVIITPTAIQTMPAARHQKVSSTPRNRQMSSSSRNARMMARSDDLQKNITASDTEKTQAANNKMIYPGLRMIAEVIAKCEEKSFRPVNFKQFIEEALSAALPCADPHSAFYDEKAYKHMLDQTAGSFSGIGVTIASKMPDDDGLVIVDVLEGGPASEATLRGDDDSIPKNGLARGDEIVEIDGDKLKGLSSDECICKLKGPSGTTTIVKVVRKKKLVEFSIVRGEVKHPIAQCYKIKNANVFYISLRLFTENAAKSLGKLLKAACAQQASGIILDLRRNPGGILDAAVDIAALFVPKGSRIVVTKDRRGNEISSYYTTTPPIYQSNIPLFILTDNFTASASEILAGALCHYSNIAPADDKNKLLVFVLGTQSFGKGSVQEVMPICNGCALKLTTMLYYLPDQTSIQATGVTPDFIVQALQEPTDETKLLKEFAGSERTLRYHITRNEVISIEKNESTPEEQPKKEEAVTEEKTSTPAQRRIKALSEDNQVQSAITLINALNMARTHTPQLVNTRQNALSYLKSIFIPSQDLAIEEIACDDESKK